MVQPFRRSLFQAEPLFRRVLTRATMPAVDVIESEKAYEITCPFRKSYPDVLMMQSGQDRNGDNDTGPLNFSMQGRIYL